MSFRRSIHRVLLTAALLLMAAEPAFAQTSGTLGGVITRVTQGFANFPTILTAFAYIAGLYLAVDGIFKFKDHVDNPVHNHLSAGVKRFLAGGMMLALPYVADVAKGSVIGTGGNAISVSGNPTSSSGSGMDHMIVQFITDIYGPMATMITAFAYIGAIVLLINGISRLIKTAQEGPRGPTGMGTIMTFLVSGALFAYGDMAGTFADSLFGGGATTHTMSSISSSVIADATDRQRIESVVNAVMAFILIVGMIAFVRGLFVLKAFADGHHQQHSLAQALTFIFGGALAINLGDLVNVLQQTVGITNGITFN